MATAAIVLDVPQSLFDAEQGSIFRFMGSGSPYLTRATLETRDRVERMAAATERHAGALAGLIERLGGGTRPRGVQPEDQYLAYLSLKFLLPKLAEAKRTTIERYENALRALRGAPEEVARLLEKNLGDHRADRAVLEPAASAARS
jgi:hypothetical protein